MNLTIADAWKTLFDGAEPSSAGAYLEGAWAPADGNELGVTNPETGGLVAVVRDATTQDADRAVSYLAREHARSRWPLWQRREALARASALVNDKADEFAAIIVAESCKTITEARGEVARVVGILRLSAEAASSLEGGVVPFDNDARGEGWTGWFTREPLGIVAAITSYNDPLGLVAHKLGPGLISGNAVVLKPSSQTPLSAFALVRVLLQAGVPASHLAALTGSQAARALVGDARVDAISFTGGREAADVIASQGRARKLLMDLGGNNALIACADADVEQVVDSIIDGAYGAAGQSCLSVQRVFVAAPLYEAVVEGVTGRAARLRVGSKLDETTEVGPLITEETAAQIVATVEEAVAAGAVLQTGGTRDGAFLTPAVLTGVPHSARLWREEIFGPVVMVEPWDDLADAVERANAVDTGLQAGVFTRDIDVALDVASRLRVGGVMINSNSDFRIDAMPFGGFKSSGIGREGVSSAVEELTEPKIVAIRRSEGAA
ncbi:aldehyde dehydrogenase family protein [Streptomyces albidoflavus]|uniref:aldehyde dehydrogenase family protein n=1 Tax=Streptomyces albidoflavus TaxID=1886 RepID=UPI00101E69D4|nr:aldehyde dehydrogenase family protein [Streptomyces albidoflavus]RZD76769.1 aldehyde dehydrogenase [Streptomyces albidoflavus]